MASGRHPESAPNICEGIGQGVCSDQRNPRSSACPHEMATSPDSTGCANRRLLVGNAPNNRYMTSKSTHTSGGHNPNFLAEGKRIRDVGKPVHFTAGDRYIRVAGDSPVTLHH